MRRRRPATAACPPASSRSGRRSWAAARTCRRCSFSTRAARPSPRPSGILHKIAAPAVYITIAAPAVYIAAQPQNAGRSGGGGADGLRVRHRQRQEPRRGGGGQLGGECAALARLVVRQVLCGRVVLEYRPPLERGEKGARRRGSKKLPESHVVYNGGRRRPTAAERRAAAIFRFLCSPGCHAPLSVNEGEVKAATTATGGGGAPCEETANGSSRARDELVRRRGSTQHFKNPRFLSLLFALSYLFSSFGIR